MTAVLIPGGAVGTIHVHQTLMRQGKPCIIAKRRGKSRHFTSVEILGPAKVIQTTEPDACGARITIKTTAHLLCEGEESDG